MAARRRLRWESENVGITFVGGLGILIFSKGLLSTIPSEWSHDQNVLILLR